MTALGFDLGRSSLRVSRFEADSPRVCNVAQGCGPRAGQTVEETLLAAAQGFIDGEPGAGVFVSRGSDPVPVRSTFRRVGQTLGLRTSRILSSPAAIAVAHGLRGEVKLLDGLGLVLDLGADHVEVALFRRVGSLLLMEPVLTSTSPCGETFDADVVAARRGATLEDARRARHALTERFETDLSSPSGGAGRLSRDQLETLVKPRLEAFTRQSLSVLERVGIRPRDLNTMLLAGGCAQMPFVRRFLFNAFGRPAVVDETPENTAVLGAALYAEQLKRGGDALLVTERLSQTLSLSMGGAVEEPLLRAGLLLPSIASRIFKTSSDQQAELEIVVTAGPPTRFKVVGLTPLPRGQVLIEVDFLVDLDGLLEIKARELPGGRNLQVIPDPHGEPHAP
ncbi:MAG: hypothetical protein EXR76_04765 [Myxococcales bacterium]|nr:hypothetical protein [Myxococcales bacterium]